MGSFLPNRLKKAREDLGLTQEAFARIFGLSSEFISLLKAGKRAPSLDTLARISAYFNKDASYFLTEKEQAFSVLFRAAAPELNSEAHLELEQFQRYAEDYLPAVKQGHLTLQNAKSWRAMRSSSASLLRNPDDEGFKVL